MAGDKFVDSGSFVAGHLAQLSLLFLCYASLGIYAIVRVDWVALVVYAGIASLSLIIRNLSAGLAALHSHGYYRDGNGNVYWAFFMWFELLTMFMSSYLVVYEKCE
ncbi:unnamed protein product [Medioppia subpectinata]|uniref:Uncharacterized protein n=1 Tax=Medioppia subpectinata TaxID=1979941 RepID=A0A7R9L3P3_9ACAR|nr:unnamed protein product [Medioppia subpectinata]CAG2113791.1 unnamed protein product [Medioppia subpectinata]